MRGATILDRILNSKEKCWEAWDVVSAKVLPPRLLWHFMTLHLHYPSDLISNHSPRSLPSSTLASLQFFKHTGTSVSQGFCTCCFLAWNTLLPYIQGLLLLLSSLNSNVTEALLDTYLYYTTQQDIRYPLYSESSPEHIFTTWSKY